MCRDAHYFQTSFLEADMKSFMSVFLCDVPKKGWIVILLFYDVQACWTSDIKKTGQCKAGF